jgi:signal transduction histidine kinase
MDDCSQLLDPRYGAVERQSRMFASFEYLREILDAWPHVAIVLNGHRQIVFFNLALYALTGPVEGKRLVGLRLGEALNCSCAVQNGDCGSNEDCRTCGAFLAIGDGLDGLYGTRECRLTQTVDGRTEWLDLSITVSPAFVSNEGFLVCAVRDITHEKRKAALERIFFHDVLNSATGVEFLANMLKTVAEGDTSLYAQQISACASQMVEEIESQQQLIAAEREELAVRPVMLRTEFLIRSTVERFRLHPLAQGRSIDIDADSQDIEMYTDDSILRRVVDNMMKNALEASRVGETVRIGCREAEAQVEIWVHNPGLVGEPVKFQVFQRSVSTKGAGRGLGTYGMRLLSERYLKGAVTFRSTAEEGTTFVARYPKSLVEKVAAQVGG